MKRNQKKVIATIATVGLSAVLLGATAFAASNNLSAYQQAKEVLISKPAAYLSDSSYTNQIILKVEKDGQPFVSTDLLTKTSTANKDSKYYNKITTNTNGKVVESETWVVNSGTKHQSIKKDSTSDQYELTETVIPKPIDDANEVTSDVTSPSMSEADKRFANSLIDLLVGDAKNYFTVDGQDVNLHLESAQIPELVQLGIASMQSQAARNINSTTEITPETTSYLTLDKELASLTDVTAEIIDVSLYENGDVKLYVKGSGYDINGKKHTYTIDFSAKRSDVNNTKVDIVDLNGKNVKTTKFENDLVVSSPSTSTASPSAN